MLFISQLIDWFTQLDPGTKFLVVLGVVVVLFVIIGIFGSLADLLDYDDRYDTDR